jgi:hypothetical protein
MVIAGITTISSNLTVALWPARKKRATSNAILMLELTVQQHKQQAELLVGPIQAICTPRQPCLELLPVAAATASLCW